MRINRPDEEYIGLFGYVEGGTIEKIHIDHSEGDESGIIGQYCVGAIVGYAVNSELTGCRNSVSVTGSLSNVGGVVGYAQSCTVQDCCNTGAVTGEQHNVGGVVGGVAGYAVSYTVQDCCNTGAVTGEQHNVGGVAGYAKDCTVQDCCNTGAVTGSLNNVAGNECAGGVVGHAYKTTVENCYSTGNVTGNASVGGIVGFVERGTVQNCIALNPAVQGSLDAARVGNVDGGEFDGQGNYAFYDMVVKVNDSLKELVKGKNAIDGADVCVFSIYDSVFWTTDINWTGSAWEFADEKLPILKNVPGEQSGEGGEHLKVDIAKASVTVTGDSTYTGSRIDPPIEVAFTGFKGRKLEEGRHYTTVVVEKEGYSDGTSAGTVKLELKGKGIFKGTQHVTYEIQPKSLVSDSVVVTVEGGPFIYDGTAHTPGVSVKDNDRSATLAEGKDYKIEDYTHNVNAGTAEVRVKGIGNYTGTETAEFTIEQRPGHRKG